MRWFWIVVGVAGTGLVLAAGCSDDEGGGEGGATTSGSTSSSSSSSGGGQGGGQGGSQGGAGGTGGSGVCAPQPLDNFTPTWTPPDPLYQERCTDAQVDDLIDACFGGSDATCTAAKAAAADCWDCMVSDFTDSTWGAIFDGTDELGFRDRNWQGCVAHAEGDLSDSGCGAKVAAERQCRWASCAGCLPVSSAILH